MASFARRLVPWLVGTGCVTTLTLGVASPANALTYVLENITFSYNDGTGTVGGNTITGSFERTNGIGPLFFRSDQSITIDFKGIKPNDFTYDSSNTTFSTTGTTRNVRFNVIGDPSPSLILSFRDPIPTVWGGTSPLLGFGSPYSVPGTGETFALTANPGGLVRAVPSPASLAALAPLTALALYRKRFSKLSS
jgi:hypothetical protein